MKFFPYVDFIEVEPLNVESVIASDERKLVEKAKVIQIREGFDKFTGISVGDIVFFRPHGFFELAEHDGEKHYVIHATAEFILGVMKNVEEK